jgi:hypothetical protein
MCKIISPARTPSSSKVDSFSSCTFHRANPYGTSAVRGASPSFAAAQIVSMRYGLTAGRPRTLQEIAAHLGLTRERVRQLRRRRSRSCVVKVSLRPDTS